MLKLFFGGQPTFNGAFVHPGIITTTPSLEWQRQPDHQYTIVFLDITYKYNPYLLWLQVNETDILEYEEPFSNISRYPPSASSVASATSSLDYQFILYLFDSTQALPPHHVNRQLQRWQPNLYGALIDKIQFRSVPSKRDMYVITGKPLGSGAVGTVYRTRDLSTTSTTFPLGRIVAVKYVVFNPQRKVDALVKARIEIKMLSLVPPHKNIVSLLDFHEDEQGIMIVTEYIEGSRTLENYIPSISSLAENEPTSCAILPASSQEDKVKCYVRVAVVDILTQLADAVRFLHQHKIVHRDIKPGNVVVKGTSPILIDFDNSCVSPDGQAEPGKPDKELVCRGHPGTPYYLAPELFVNKNLSPDKYYPVDIYSLGATFYYVVAFAFGLQELHPFEGDTYKDLMLKVTRDEPTPLKSGIDEIDALVMHMIARSSAARPTAEEVYVTLVKIFKEM